MSTIIEAEFVEFTHLDEPTEDAQVQKFGEPSQGIRRAPKVKETAVTMPLERWLEVDRTLHELYQLCEFAIWQRDQANNRNESAEKRAQALEEHVALLSTRLHLWMEERMENDRENKEIREEAEHMRRVAAEALSLSVFDRKRRKELLDQL